MRPPLRTCLPLAIVAALCLPSLPVDAQQQRPPAKPAAKAKPKGGPTPPPIACAEKRLVGLDGGQTESLNFWLRAQGPSERMSVVFSCKLDRTQIIVGLATAPADKEKEQGEQPRHAISVLDLSLDPPPARLLRNGPVIAPVVIVRPGGGMSLVFAESVVEKGLTQRAYRAVDVTSAKVQTLFSMPVDTQQFGCMGRPQGVDRFVVAADAALVDVGDNGPYGLAIEYEFADCKAGGNHKRADTFVATPDGFEEFK